MNRLSRWGFALTILGLLVMLSGIFTPRMAESHDPETPLACAALYNVFLDAQTLEAAGKAALDMHYTGCWPGIQGEDFDPHNVQYSQTLPEITDCASLSVNVQALAEQYKDDGEPQIQKVLRSFATSEQQRRFMTAGGWYEDIPENSTRVLDCLGEFRVQGYGVRKRTKEAVVLIGSTV